ncbi:MAG: GAF domain-containing protein [Anaerolineae bacterium]|nr:GAF domain-containing protein [Anaerolineae bacterium]
MSDESTNIPGQPEQPAIRISIGNALNIYSLALAIIPVLVVISVALGLFGQQARDQALNQMKFIAQARGEEVERWIEASQLRLSSVLALPERQLVQIRSTVDNQRPNAETVSFVRGLLQDQLNAQDSFSEFFIYTPSGRVNVSTNVANERTRIDDAPYFEPSLEQTYIQAPYLRTVTTIEETPGLEASTETTTIMVDSVITTPVTNLDGEIIGVLAGRLNLNTLNGLLAPIDAFGDTGETYLVSAEKFNIITPTRFDEYNPDIRYDSRGIREALFGRTGGGFYINYRSENVIGAYTWIDRLDAGLLAEFDEDEALEAVNNVRDVSLIAAVIMAVLGLIVGRFVTRWLTKPIARLTNIAQLAIKGDYTQRARLKQVSEIGRLGFAFDTMLDNLVQSIRERNARIREVMELSASLETRVAERTRDLRLASDVSRQITTVLDINQLLQEVVKSTVETFKFYACFIFRIEPTTLGIEIIRAAGADANGNVDVSQYLPIESDTSGSVVAQAAFTGQIVTVNDVAIPLDYFSDPLLPKTRSQVAIPIMLGTKLLGIFDFHASQTGRFRPEEISTLTTLAEQVAIAMRNAQLFSQSQTAQQEAEEANRVKSQFLANMSHELRTPLNAILNFTEFVMDGDLGEVNEEQEETLQKVVSSGEHLLSLINDILDITKIEVGMLELFIEDVDINQSLKAVISTGKGLVKGKPIDLNIEVEDKLPTISGDRRRLHQVFLNLLSNAVKFTPSGGVTLKAYREDEGIHISVKDTGVGIAPKDHAKVFERFKQSESGLRTAGGTGLGLPISKHFVEAHGGRIWFESDLGQGSTFHVWLALEGK